MNKSHDDIHGYSLRVGMNGHLAVGVCQYSVCSKQYILTSFIHSQLVAKLVRNLSEDIHSRQKSHRIINKDSRIHYSQFK